MSRVDRWLDALEQGPEVTTPGPVGAAVRLFNEGTPLPEAFDTLLTQLRASQGREVAEVQKEVDALDKREADLREDFIHAIVKFLHRSNPELLTPQAREILRSHTLLLKSLRTSVDDLAARLAQFE